MTLVATSGEPLKYPHLASHSWPTLSSRAKKVASLLHPESLLAWTPAGRTTPTGCQGCLLHWENQSGSRVRHQGKQTDLGETKYTGSFLPIQVRRAWESWGEGGLQEIKAGYLEIESTGSFVCLRPDKAHTVCLTWSGRFEIVIEP